MELQLSVVNFRYFAFSLIVCLWLYWLWSRRQYYAFALRFPGKLGLPIIGNLHLFRNILSDLQSFGTIFERGQQTVCIWLGVQPTIFTTEPEVIEKILTSPDCVEKATGFYEPIHFYLEGGLLTAGAKKWRFHRKILSVIFKQKTLLGFFPIFNAAKNKMSKDFEQFADGKEHFVLDAILLNMGRAVMETSLNIPNFDDKFGLKLMHSFTYLHNVIAKEMFVSSMKLNRIVRLFSNSAREVKFTTDFLEKYFNTKFGGKENTLEDSAKHIQNENSADEYEQNRNFIVDHIYKLYKEQQFSREDIFSETKTLIVASLETTANTIYSTVIFLAMHPLIQQRLFEEIAIVFSEKDTEVEYSHFKQLPYLERVLLETMRLAPAGPIIGRRNVKPIELLDGHIAPENMNLFISIFHLHRSEKLWGPNAKKFDPDNFLPENTATRHPFAYIPFSKGARNCFGLRYAQLVQKVMVIGLIRNFRFETDFRLEDVRLKFHLTSAFKEDPGIRVYRRL